MIRNIVLNDDNDETTESVVNSIQHEKNIENPETLQKKRIRRRRPVKIVKEVVDLTRSMSYDSDICPPDICPSESPTVHEEISKDSTNNSHDSRIEKPSTDETSCITETSASSYKPLKRRRRRLEQCSSSEKSESVVQNNEKEEPKQTKQKRYHPCGLELVSGMGFGDVVVKRISANELISPTRAMFLLKF